MVHNAVGKNIKTHKELLVDGVRVLIKICSFHNLSIFICLYKYICIYKKYVCVLDSHETDKFFFQEPHMRCVVLYRYVDKIKKKHYYIAFGKNCQQQWMLFGDSIVQRQCLVLGSSVYLAMYRKDIVGCFVSVLNENSKFTLYLLLKSQD